LTGWQQLPGLDPDAPATRTIVSHRQAGRGPRRARRLLVACVVLLVLASGVLVARAALGGGTPGPAGSARPRLTRGDALASDAPSLSPPLVFATGATPNASPDPPSPAPSSAPSSATTPAPTRSTATTTAPPPFVAVSAEAEAGMLSGTASAVACALCSGGQRVRFIDGVSAVVVRLDISRAGARTVRITYEVDGSRQVKIQVNGVDVDIRWVTGTGWDTPATFEFPAQLPAGPVEVRFYNDENPAPDFDQVTIS
jgi:hypothetical protein